MVRSRRWLVDEVIEVKSPGQTCITQLSCADDDAHLREAYQGEPYATKVLVPEAYEETRSAIDAATLQKRLPAALAAAEQRERMVYRETDTAAIHRVLKSYRDFVELRARKQQESGHPCLIIASY